MPKSLLEDAFAHHVWATQRLIDACLGLSPEQLRTVVPGTYGSILETFRHLVEGDSFYLGPLTGEPTPVTDEAHLDLPELRAAMEAHGAAWSRLLAQDLDPDADFKGVVEDGARIGAGEKLAWVEANARALLGAERVGLNLAGLLSGVATLTRA